ncbi:hypothetical protein [Sphingobium yanoikuyae]|jgi:hypothetical protein|uniref:hypothetical protein n=1 Tax=Sphingobium yanoikuyae TaxID=13690 RepID=UPI0012906760|nr:hypothetical protein [Sphingobium yanoikuyae]
MLTLMTDVNQEWSLSNPGPDALLVWLEPWCDEFEVPVRSVITLKTSGDLEIEWTSENLVVWASGPTVSVFINDERQKSGAESIPIPDGLTKGILNILFADQPTARLGGRTSQSIGPISWWCRVKGLFSR